MAVKLFILGLPGSGKSAIARYIGTSVRDKHLLNMERRWCIERFNDYGILNEMSTDERWCKYFRPAEPSGFDVLDYKVLDEALRLLEKRFPRDSAPTEAKPEEIDIIEFSRNDYRHTFHQFSQAFFQDAFFIHLEATVQVCKQRIHERAHNPTYLDDDYSVSDYIFEEYYRSDDGRYLSDSLARDFGIGRERVLAIDNNGDLKSAAEKISPFVDSIIATQSTLHSPIIASSGFPQEAATYDKTKKTGNYQLERILV